MLPPCIEKHNLDLQDKQSEG